MLRHRLFDSVVYAHLYDIHIASAGIGSCGAGDELAVRRPNGTAYSKELHSLARCKPPLPGAIDPSHHKGVLPRTAITANKGELAALGRKRDWTVNVDHEAVRLTSKDGHPVEQIDRI